MYDIAILDKYKGNYITMQRHSIDGFTLCYETLSIRYVGYSKTEAVKRFKKEITKKFCTF